MSSPAKKSAKVDVAIPIAFPDYLIHVELEVPRLDLPVFGKVGGQKMPARVPQLGHAGVLFLSGATGTTKYYEYGRYAPSAALGRVRKHLIPNVVAGADGHPTRDSLQKALTEIAKLAGQSGRIEGAYIAVPGKYPAMLAYAQKREAGNGNTKREPYDLTTNSCMHFAKWTVEASGTMLPSGLIPSPADWIEDVQDRFPDLEFGPKDGLTVRYVPAEAAVVPSWATQKSWLRSVLEGDCAARMRGESGFSRTL